MRALSDALPTGHRAMANPTLQLHFGCGRATPPVSHSHNWPSGRMQNFLFKIGQKSYFLPIKTPKLILTIEWYYRSMYCRSNAMSFFKMANLKAISSSATLIGSNSEGDGCLGPGGGGSVSDRDAQHLLSTRNATRVKIGGSKLYILPYFDEK